MRKSLLFAAASFILFSSACGSSPVPQVTATPTATATIIPTDQPTLKATIIPTSAPTLKPQRPEAVGKSDKSVSSLNESFTLNNVRNDVTSKWRICTIISPIYFEEYALSYYNKYYKPGETHWIINFTTKKTMSLNCYNGVIYLDVREYVDKEEHDAKILGNGITLASFAIYTDNGDIERLK